ncbi:TPA: hypothetical protein I8045_002951 [Legionella pneumophila]|nr:hypothetical protein [Legionella pneumophila]HAT2146688.1 hypothetical protein [Legionella pneumophila]HAT2161804.1 hypothetical protein [Legionella pneumophila]HAU1509935.1 hypothetical protein [Legionella pneumophila]HBJ7674071.1 hypothetical protein [Legionella pneumophila]
MAKTTQPPTLSRQALLALVDWVSKNKIRSERVEFHGMGAAPIREPEAVDQFIGKTSTETAEGNDSRGSKSC